MFGIGNFRIFGKKNSAAMVRPLSTFGLCAAILMRAFLDVFSPELLYKARASDRGKCPHLVLEVSSEKISIIEPLSLVSRKVEERRRRPATEERRHGMQPARRSHGGLALLH